MSTQAIQDATRPAPPRTDLKIEVVALPVSDVDRANASTRPGLAAGRRFRERRRLAARADDTSRLAVLRHVRQGVHARRAGIGSGHVPRGR